MTRPVSAASGAVKPFDARALTEQLAKMPDVVARLCAVHLPDRSGRHCRDCRGAQGAPARWPCTLRTFADAAQQLIDIRGR
ncbi:MAG: hypothetical protein ACRDRH_02585 [Pseudonocardia sp.]